MQTTLPVSLRRALSRVFNTRVPDLPERIDAMQDGGKPEFSGEPQLNLQWNRWRWGNAEKWAEQDRYGYRWSGGTQQHNDSPAQLVQRYLLPHLLGKRSLKIMEIGAGAGRFSAELVRLSSSIHLVDLNAACIDICRKRFLYFPRVFFHVNDGLSLGEVEDEDFDLIATLDTMIHVAPEIVLSYLEQSAARLKPGGILWLDHSGQGENLNRYRTALTADVVAQAAREHDLSVEAQYQRANGDCISVLRKGEPVAARGQPPVDGSLRRQIAVVDAELDKALAHTSEWNRSRIPYLRGTFIRILRNITIPDSRSTRAPLLEIGADGQLASAKVLSRLTGLEVIASNLAVAGLSDRIGDYPIKVHQGRIGSLEFPDNSFSMLYGRSILEHVSGLPHFLAECYRVLEPGGVMYLDGGAFYYSPRGHHMAVKGASGTHYGFDVMPDLIPPWFHLQVNQDQLRSYLCEEKLVPEDDAEIIARYIFTSPEQNRMTAGQILAAFQSALFRSINYECTFVKDDPPEELLSKHSLFDLKCHGISFCVVK